MATEHSEATKGDETHFLFSVKGRGGGHLSGESFSAIIEFEKQIFS